MRLTRLELSGFKAVAGTVELPFEAGVTAVVGPNGCGKSNISDAVRWVLGEQSPRLLRGGKMEDVIFQGAPAGRPLEDHVLHFPAAQQAGRLLAQHPPYGVGDVRLAASVRAHDRGDTGLERQLHRSRNRFEARQLESGQSHCLVLVRVTSVAWTWARLSCASARLAWSGVSNAPTSRAPSLPHETAGMPRARSRSGRPVWANEREYGARNRSPWPLGVTRFAHSAARASTAESRVVKAPASTRYHRAAPPPRRPSSATGVTNAGNGSREARRSTSASALSALAYAASWTVQGSVSSRGVGTGVGRARCGGGAGLAARCSAPLARKDSPPVANNTHPTAAPPMSVAATTAGRVRRLTLRPSARAGGAGRAIRGVAAGTSGSGVQRSRTTPTNGMPRSSAALIPWPMDDSGSKPSGESTIKPSGTAESRASAPAER